MVQTAKSMVTEMPTLGSTEFVMVDKDKLSENLKEWGESIVYECAKWMNCDIHSEIVQEIKDQI